MIVIPKDEKNRPVPSRWVIVLLGLFTVCAALTVTGQNTGPALPAQTNLTIMELTTLTVTNTAMDTNVPPLSLAYTLVNPQVGMSIATNGVITWTPTEAQGPSTTTITTVVHDNGTPPLSATNAFTVVVNETNEAPVLPIQTNRVLQGQQLLIVTNTATDSDIPANTLSYQLVEAPAGAAMDNNGVIYWTPSPAQVPSIQVITTYVTDYNPSAVNSKHLSTNNSFTVVVCGTIALSPASLPAAAAGAVYSQNLSASNGAAPYTFAVTMGSLPAGLTLATNRLSGIPSAIGTNNFTVTATDTNGCNGSQAYTLAVLGAAPSITSQPLSATNLAGTTASFTVTASGTAPLYYQWQFNGTNLTDSLRITGSQSNLLSLASVQAGDAGNYQVIVTNSYGLATSAVAALTVTGQNTGPAGPFYPPPLGVTFNTSGATGDGNIARPGGKTYFFSGANLANFDPLFWGAKASAVKLSLYDSTFSAGGEVMSFNPGQSTLPSGLVVWTGNTYMNSPSGLVGLSTRCWMQASAPLVSPPALGIPASVGGVVSIPSASFGWQATMYMEVFDTVGFVSLNNWVAAYSFYDASHWDVYNAGAYSSFDAGFWFSNRPPAITAITNLVMAPGSSVGPIPFTIGDVETSAAGLLVSKNSDNPAVLPSSQITLGGSGSNRTVTMQTSAATVGVAQVTISVQDSDGAIANRIFVVTNDTPPTISGFTNQLIQMNAALGPINFTVSDAETAASSLVVTGLTSNPSLVAATNIFIGGSDTNRTLTVVPTTNQYGSAVISVQVSDGLLTTVSNFTLTVNSPPHLDANNQLVLSQGTTAPLTSTELDATDPESSPAGLIFTVNPDAGGGPPFYGTLKKSGLPLGTGGTFTMADVLNGFVTYTHDGSCSTNDNFQMGLTDDMGGVWSDTGHTVFTFHVGINPLSIAPVAFGSSLNLGLGSTYNGSLVVSNGDCRNTTLTYSIVTGPTNGNLASFNPATGQFTYQAPANGGVDQFTFQVSNGVLSAASPGVINVTIQNQPPTAQSTNFTVLQGGSRSAALTASDPDRPPQTLTFSIVAQGTKGTAVITGPTSGAFTYTPQAGQTGADSFTFKVNDGLVDSAAAQVSVNISPAQPPLAQNGTNSTTQGVAVPGLLSAMDTNLPPFPLTFSIVSNGVRGTALITNASTGGYLYTPQPGRFGTDIFAFKASNGITDSAPATVTVGIRPQGALFGDILIADSQEHSVRLLNPTNGDLGMLSSGGNITSPTFLVSEPGGTVLLVDQQGGLLRINPTTGVQTVLVPGNQFAFPVGVALEPAGTILVTDPFAGAIKRFSSTGTFLTNIPLGSLMFPAGVAVSGKGQIFVVDAAFFGGNPAANKVVQIDPVNFNQTVLSTTGLLAAPVGIAIEPEGNLLIAQSAADLITRIELPGGAQSNLSTNGLLNGDYSVALDQAAHLYAANQDGHSVIQVDRLTGAQTAIPSGDAVGQPFGIAIAGQPVAPPRISGLVATPPGSPTLTFAGYPGATYSIYESADLSAPLASWNLLGAASETAPGQFQFIDSGASGSTARFYIVRYP